MIENKLNQYVIENEKLYQIVIKNDLNQHETAMLALRHFINNNVEGLQNDPINIKYTRICMELFKYLEKLNIQKYPEMKYKEFAQTEFYDDMNELVTAKEDNNVSVNVDEIKLYKDYSNKKKLLFIWKDKKIEIVFSILVTDKHKAFSVYRKSHDDEYCLKWLYSDKVNSDNKLIDEVNKKLIKIELKKYLPKKKENNDR